MAPIQVREKRELTNEEHLENFRLAMRGKIADKTLQGKTRRRGNEDSKGQGAMQIPHGSASHGTTPPHPGLGGPSGQGGETV